jgi:hypothetical protein
MTQKKFSQLPEDEKREELVRNRKVKTEDFSTFDPYKMDKVIEEKEDTEVLT